MIVERALRLPLVFGSVDVELALPGLAAPPAPAGELVLAAVVVVPRVATEGALAPPQPATRTVSAVSATPARTTFRALGAVFVPSKWFATATARLVGPDGKPLSHFTPRATFLMVVTPGEFSNTKNRKEEALTPHAAGPLTAIDPVNYPAPPASDGDGRIVFPALIPGTTYHLRECQL